MTELLFMIITVIGAFAAPIVIPGIIYDATGNEEVSNIAQVIIAIMDMLVIVPTWILFFC